MAPGLLLAIAAGLHSKTSPRKFWIKSVITIAFWPFLILLSPAFFVSQEDTDDIVDAEKEDSMSRALGPLPEADIAALSDKERSHLKRTQRAKEKDVAFFSDSTDFEHVLLRLWDDAIPPSVYHQVESAKWEIEHEYDDDDGYDAEVLFARSEPDWYVGFSVEFVKSIAKLDKNKRARLLEAISHLAAAPVTPYGDTVKPLTGEMAGLWRYRLGDDRLIYSPNAQEKKVTLISFGARGDIY
jgi:mRNA interferase RelE/StbE